jgi:hypothetical protein
MPQLKRTPSLPTLKVFLPIAQSRGMNFWFEEQSTQELTCPYEHKECDHPLYLASGAVTCHPECVRQYAEPLPAVGSR